MSKCCSEDGKSGKLPHSRAVRLDKQVEYAGGSIVSRTIIDSEAGSVTLFAFDAKQNLSEHTAPFDALVQVLDGRMELTIGGEKVIAETGMSVIMPADVPHALKAAEKSKVLLVMIKG